MKLARFLTPLIMLGVASCNNTSNLPISYKEVYEGLTTTHEETMRQLTEAQKVYQTLQSNHDIAVEQRDSYANQLLGSEGFHWANYEFLKKELEGKGQEELENSLDMMMDSTEYLAFIVQEDMEKDGISPPTTPK